MLRYAFVFFVTLVAICFGLFFGYIYSQQIIVEKGVLTNANSIGKAFQNTVWSKYSFILEIHKHDIPKYKLTSQFSNFQSEATNFFSDFKVEQAEVFSADNQKLFSLNRYFEHKHDSSHHGFGYTFSTYFLDNKNNIVAMVPILEGGEKLCGMIEITYNISWILDPIKKIWIIFSGFILFVFLLFFFWSIIKLRSGSRILNEQFSINSKLKLAKENIEELSLKKSQFLANVSHELKTPLNAIIGFSDLIQNASDIKEEYKGYAADIYNSGTHLLNLINDILDFSKSELNKLKIKSNLFDLAKLIEICVRMTTAKAKNVKVENDFFQDKILIQLDHKRMKQVLLNILSNSVKFTNESGIIKISIQTIGEELVIKISDNGIGIAEKDLAKALSAFGQSNSELSRKYGGTGIGLPFSKNLVELMGGIFSIESKQNVGTTIAIRLPYKKDELQES